MFGKPKRISREIFKTFKNRMGLGERIPSREN
jgi:hypothetical protein